MSATPIDSKTMFGRTPDRGVARRQAFLLAAREVFLEQGYEAASVNDVVRRAGGSLATLYAQFGNKEGLFLAVVQDQHERFIRVMTPDSVDHLALETGPDGDRRTICARAAGAGQPLLLPHHVGEARKFPEQLQRYISTAGADKVREVIATFLQTRGVAVPIPMRPPRTCWNCSALPPLPRAR